jgi:AcrR family transcriptional regulator
MDKEERRNIILESAKKLFALNGYHSTGISHIINEAKIARGTFYLYFNSKHQLFETIIDNAVQTIVSKFKPILTGDDIDCDAILRQLRINLAHSLGTFFNDKNLARIFVSEAEGIKGETSEKLGNFYKYLVDWLEESIDEGQTLGIVRRCNSRITAIAYVGMLKGIIWSFAVGGENIDFHEVVEEITANVSKGIIIG